MFAGNTDGLSFDAREQLATDLLGAFTASRSVTPRKQERLTTAPVLPQKYDAEVARELRLTAYAAKRDEIMACRRYWALMPAPGARRHAAVEANVTWTRAAKVAGERHADAYKAAHQTDRDIVSYMLDVFEKLFKSALVWQPEDAAFEQSCKLTEILLAGHAAHV